MQSPVSVITGASSGLGRALALELAAQGHWVVACARSHDALWQLAEQPNANGRILPCVMDMTDVAQIQQAFTTVQQRFGQVDNLILNAGSCEYVDINTLDVALFRRLFELNFFAQVQMIQTFLPLLKTSPNPVLALVSSLAHLFPFSKNQAYGASKAAVSYFADSLRVDCPELTVQLIEPGFVDTPLTQKNQFSMPFLLSAENAARRMATALHKRQLRLQFPARLVWTLKLLNCVPYRWRQRLAALLGRQQQ